jgi:hypothetical protein
MSELADVMFKASAALASLAQAVELQSFTTKNKPEVPMEYPSAMPQAFSALANTVEYGPSEILKFEDSLRVDNSVTVGLQNVTPADLTKGTQERALKVLADVTCSAFTSSLLLLLQAQPAFCSLSGRTFVALREHLRP